MLISNVDSCMLISVCGDTSLTERFGSSTDTLAGLFISMEGVAVTGCVRLITWR